MFLTPIEVRCTNQLSNENKLCFCNWCNPLEEISNLPFDFITSPVSTLEFALRMWRYSNPSHYAASTQRKDLRFLSQGLSIQQHIQVFRGKKTKLKTLILHLQKQRNLLRTAITSSKWWQQMLLLISLLDLVEPILNT